MSFLPACGSTKSILDQMYNGTSPLPVEISNTDPIKTPEKQLDVLESAPQK